MYDEKCETCRYYKNTTCRRNAPEIGLIEAVWPITKPDDWCGEFMRKGYEFKTIKL